MAQIFRAKKTSNKGKVLTLDVKSLDHQGRGVANHNGKVCFIDGALPNERVKAQILDEKSKLIEAKQVKVLTPSEERIDPFCQHYGVCGGCQLQHLKVDSQITYKQQAVGKLFEKFAKETHLAWQPAITSEDKYYRRSARIACISDKKTKQFKLGFRAQKSKQIVEVENCPVLNIAFEELFTQLRLAVTGNSKLHSISHVQLCEADNGVFVLIRHTKAIDDNTKQILITALSDSGVQVLWDDGKEPVTYEQLPNYRVDGIEFGFQLNNFIQVNGEVNEKMLMQSLDWLALSEKDTLLDLFCGIGNFSLLAAKYAKRVVGVEGVDSSVQRAKANAAQNQLENVSFECFDLTDDISSATWFDKQANVLILDPSRTGAYDVLKQLPLNQFEKILYVSCDPVTLARDSALVLEAGFTISKVGLMNMFPHTGHIETMALFQRR
ncbi:23S rRNA (uracil(1939)-C(5))-methyltransferase RlmD [Pseudoalteromonas phenolica]|uniref:23S rRNA (uracil(1939)-C(5))-methyltransferase RlmD n=1 Tax=Pseudoalteromonas phenolica TaxID=161398 RepID=UPI00110B3C61|nr:23S rRNA (uracil(1939)-C(5))-methyltransferase RlmD [Pseudoalteromonas phenolica]TMO58194.1 23S rRNA (uracil(1939)-C(5))-methyltransferase RlmD [Pseudoalteromonas phenolica]